MTRIHLCIFSFIFLVLFSSCSLKEKKEYNAVMENLSIQNAEKFITNYPNSKYNIKIYQIFSQMYWENPSADIAEKLLLILPEDSQEYMEIYNDWEERN